MQQNCRYQFFALGSDCELQIFADREDIAHQAAIAAQQEIQRIEMRYSRYRPESEVSRLNAIARSGGSIEVDAETAGLLDYARACFAKSDGLFDITSGLLRKAWDFSSGKLPDDATMAALLPRIGFDKILWEPPRLTFTIPDMEIDFGGIGKEYAADRAAEICRAMGVQAGLVDLGGDIRLIGSRLGGDPWRLGIRHPRRPAEPIVIVELHSGALATSGDYERFIEVEGRRYCHILNPRTGFPTQDLSSVSVIADACLVAGSAATIAMLKGRDGPAWLHARGLRHVFIDAQGKVGGTEMAA